MESQRYNDAFEFLTHAEEIITEGYQDEVRRVQEDMVAGIEESIRLGWMTQEEGDQKIYDWMQKWCPGRGSVE